MPRRVQRIILWFFALYGAVVLVSGRHIPRLYEIYTRGISTTGTITRRVGDRGLEFAYAVRGQRYIGIARIGVAAIPISAAGDPIYLTYLPRDPSVNVAGDVKDLLFDEYEKCAAWLPWVAATVLFLFAWNALMREYWFRQSPFAGSRWDRLSRFLFGD